MKNILIFVVLLAFCSCTKEKELTKLNEPISDTVQCVVENIKSNPSNKTFHRLLIFHLVKLESKLYQV